MLQVNGVHTARTAAESSATNEEDTLALRLAFDYVERLFALPIRQLAGNMLMRE